jgi:hypothetical protein
VTTRYRIGLKSVFNGRFIINYPQQNRNMLPEALNMLMAVDSIRIAHATGCIMYDMLVCEVHKPRGWAALNLYITGVFQQ